MKTHIPYEHKKRVDLVVRYILENLTNDLSLDRLAQEATYSPFHFQKIFKQVIGLSPKQYIIRLRLEMAAHHLLIFPYKSVQEVAFDCGFSSPAVFARAFRNYFRITAQEIRSLEPQDNLKIRKEASHLIQMVEQKKVRHETTVAAPSVEVRMVSAMKCLCLHASLNDEVMIENTFKDLMYLAETHHILQPDTPRLMGIIFPFQDRYSASLLISANTLIPPRTDILTTREGKYAVFRVRGRITEMFETLRVLHDHWLPEHGYQIAETSGFEIIIGNPSHTRYADLEREVYVPIERA